LRSIAILVGITVTALAQPGGIITGTVSDIVGDRVANAPIEATNVVTKAVYKVASTGDGSYTLAQLPAGEYDLSVAAPGFIPYAQKSVKVIGAQPVHLDIRLTDYQLNTLGDGRDFRIALLTPHATPSGATPRTAEGRPDLTGVWYAQRTVDPRQTGAVGMGGEAVPGTRRK